jgi:hypothetical protein
MFALKLQRLTALVLPISKNKSLLPKEVIKEGLLITESGKL